MNAVVREIPRRLWLVALNKFSRQYGGYRVSVDLLSPEWGAQPLVHERPFLGLSFEPHGSQAGDIMVEIGDTPENLMDHHVRSPQRLWVSETQPGGDVDIEIESEGEIKTLIRLQPNPALPEAE
jgi:hypothetical protein